MDCRRKFRPYNSEYRGKDYKTADNSSDYSNFATEKLVTSPNYTHLPNGKKLLEEQLHAGYAPAYRCRAVLIYYHPVRFQELSGHAGYGHVYSVTHILVA